MIKFESKEQVINALNSAELWLGVFQDKKDWFYTRMECFDNPYHIMVQLDYYCDRWFKPMLYNIRLIQAIKWSIDNNKTLDELNDVINDVLLGKTAYLVLTMKVEEDDEIPF